MIKKTDEIVIFSEKEWEDFLQINKKYEDNDVVIEKRNEKNILWIPLQDKICFDQPFQLVSIVCFYINKIGIQPNFEEDYININILTPNYKILKEIKVFSPKVPIYIKIQKNKFDIKIDSNEIIDIVDIWHIPVDYDWKRVFNIHQVELKSPYITFDKWHGVWDKISFVKEKNVLNINGIYSLKYVDAVKIHTIDSLKLLLQEDIPDYEYYYLLSIIHEWIGDIQKQEYILKQNKIHEDEE